MVAQSVCIQDLERMLKEHPRVPYRKRMGQAIFTDEEVKARIQNSEAEAKSLLASGDFMQAFMLAIETGSDKVLYNNRGILLERTARAAFENADYAVARWLIQQAVATYKAEVAEGNYEQGKYARQLEAAFLSSEPDKIYAFRMECSEPLHDVLDTIAKLDTLIDAPRFTLEQQVAHRLSQIAEISNYP